MPASPEMIRPKVVCVLGMHRSGTSLVTRILNLLGVYLGTEPQLPTPAQDNPKGHWEHGIFRELNDEILARHGGTWDQPPRLSTGWEANPGLDDLKHRASTLIQDEFAHAEIWGWKDPRTCLTLPFWQQLLPETHYVVCLRNPVDVAHSLRRRNSFSVQKSSSLWLTYVNA